ncbi:hypothetical protein Tco_1234107 [Tanacetum coccineum]
MATLESCLKHNMVAYLEKTNGNAEFHEVIDFLKRSYIHHALTAIFDAIQSMGYEGDLTVLTFNKALFSPQWRFLFHTMNHCISSKSTSWDQIPTNIATAVICLTTHQKYNFSKLIFDGMIRLLDVKKKFRMYPRFLSILLGTQLKNIHVPQDHFLMNALTSKMGEAIDRPFDLKSPEEEGEALENEPEPQPIPSPIHHHADLNEPQTELTPNLTPPIPDSIPQGDGGTTGDQSSNDKSLSGSEEGLTLQSLYELCVSLCQQVSDQAIEIKELKAQVKKLKRRANPLIKFHKAWVRATKMKKKGGVFKQRRKVVKSSKGDPSAHKDPAFEDFKDDFEGSMDDAMEYERTEEDKNDVSTGLHQGTEELKVNTDSQKEGTNSLKVITDIHQVSTDREKEGTDSLKVSTASTKLSTDGNEEGTGAQDDTTFVTPPNWVAAE